MKDDDFLDMTKFLDEISIDVKKTYINVHFLTPYELKIKSDAILEKLPLFKNKSGYRSTNWSNRIDEELRIFDYLRNNYINTIGFPVFDNLKPLPNNNRIWTCIFRISKKARGIKLEIRLGVRYPKQIPTVSRTTGDRHHSSVAKCFGQLIRRWRPGFGIAHFITMIGYYYALDKKSEQIK